MWRLVKDILPSISDEVLIYDGMVNIAALEYECICILGRSHKTPCENMRLIFRSTRGDCFLQWLPEEVEFWVPMPIPTKYKENIKTRRRKYYTKDRKPKP